MGGINLVDQLKNSGGDTYANAPISDGGGMSMSKMSFSTDDFGKEDLLRLILILVGLGLVWGAKYFVQDYGAKQIEENRVQIAKLDTEITSIQNKLGTLKELKAEEEAFVVKLAELQKKMDLVENTGRHRNLLVRMIDFIVNEMPSSIWLTGINADVGLEAKIDLFGNATSMQLVSEFMKRLEGAVFFPNWNLVETVNVPATAASDGRTRVGPSESKSFTIGAKVIKP